MASKLSIVLPLAALALLVLAYVPGASAAEQGKLTGAKTSTHPDWFKDSFLQISDDVDEANDAGKHVLLFMEMNGCPYCFKMIEENFKDAPYKAFIRDNFDVIAFNVKGDREVALSAETSATEKEIAVTLGVTYTPMLIFLNSDNKPVVRVNGYRNVDDFKVVLNYVQQKAYESGSLTDYVASHRQLDAYEFRDHLQFRSIEDLSGIEDKPLALLFEDKGCVACDALHDGHLADSQIREVLKNFVVVRLDAMSDDPITDIDGSSTTAKDLATRLGITYRPALVLFDKGREIARIENQLYSYHFTGILEYVGERQYEVYPDSPFRYIDAKTAKLMAEGKDVSISDE